MSLPLMGAGLSSPVKLNMQSLPQNLLTSAGTLIEDFEDATEWTRAGSGSSHGNDAVHFKTGAQSITATAAVGALCQLTKTVNLDLSSMATAGRSMRLWVYLTTAVSADTNAILTFTSIGTFAKRFAATFKLPRAGWNQINLISSDFVNTGGESWANAMVRLRLTLNSPAATAATVSYDDLRVNVIGVPAVYAALGDGRESCWTVAYSYTNPKHFRMSVSMATGRIGDAGYVSAAQLQALAAAGWGVNSHTRSGTDLSTLSQADQITELQNAYNDLAALNIITRDVVYPSGGWNADTLIAMGATAPTMLTGQGIVLNSAAPVLPFDNMLIIGGGQVSTVLATLKGYVDTAIARGEILATGWDDVGVGLSEADFQAWIDYCITKQIIPVTMSDLRALQTGPLDVVRPW